MKEREIIEKGDYVVLNRDYFINSEEFKIHRLRFGWTPDKNEVFIVKKTFIRPIGKGESELRIGIYKKGKKINTGYTFSSENSAKVNTPFTSMSIPAKYLQWIIQTDGDKVIKKIFISKAFNSDLFISVDGFKKWVVYEYFENKNVPCRLD